MKLVNGRSITGLSGDEATFLERILLARVVLAEREEREQVRDVELCMQRVQCSE